MKVVMYELEHCPNCTVVTRMLESKVEGIEIEHRIMDHGEIDEFIAKGLTSSPVVSVGDRLFSASNREERQSLIETLNAMGE